MARLTQVFIERPDRDGWVAVDGDEAGHLLRVLRLGVGDSFIGFDGMGLGWEVEITEVGKGKLRGRVERTLEDKPASPRITVAVGAVKAARMDWAVEKAAELGAVKFIPLDTIRSVVEPGTGKVRRWRGIAIAAAKQSHHYSLMHVDDPIKLSEFLRNLSGTILICDMTDEPLASLQKKIGKPEDMTILIGPEGGWEDREREAIAERGGVAFPLGGHILRTETAVAASITLAKVLFGGEL